MLDAYFEIEELTKKQFLAKTIRDMFDRDIDYRDFMRLMATSLEMPVKNPRLIILEGSNCGKTFIRELHRKTLSNACEFIDLVVSTKNQRLSTKEYKLPMYICDDQYGEFDICKLKDILYSSNILVCSNHGTKTIARYARCFHTKVNFVKNPDPNDKCSKPAISTYEIIEDPEYRRAYVELLLEHKLFY